MLKKNLLKKQQLRKSNDHEPIGFNIVLKVPHCGIFNLNTFKILI